MIKEVLELGQIDPKIVDARMSAVRLLEAYNKCLDSENKEVLWKMFCGEVRHTLDCIAASKAGQVSRLLDRFRSPEISKN